MSDAVIKYAKRHGKLVFAIIAAVFAIGGMFATARADMETIKSGYADHEKRLDDGEDRDIRADSKLDRLLEDTKLLKEALLIP